MKISLTHILLIVILIVGILVFFLFTRDAVSPGEEPTVGAPTEPVGNEDVGNEDVGNEDVGNETGSEGQCPVATPEFFTVEPVTSPTDRLSQVVSVDLGNGETITITTESGLFTAPFDTFPQEIEISLLPNTTHNLTVEGRVREVTQGECTYGGYTLSTTRDRYGDPLVIEQKQP